MHKFLCISQAMKILDTEAAVDKRRKKFEKLSVWHPERIKKVHKDSKIQRTSRAPKWHYITRLKYVRLYPRSIYLQSSHDEGRSKSHKKFQVSKIIIKYGRSRDSSRTKFVRTSAYRALEGQTNWGDSIRTWIWEKNNKSMKQWSRVSRVH